MLSMICQCILEDKIEELKSRENRSREEDILLEEAERELIILRKLSVLDIDFQGTREEFEKRYEDAEFHIMTKESYKSACAGTAMWNHFVDLYNKMNEGKA